MATTSTVIGQSTFVHGRVSGTGDLEIAGRVEGDVACSGEVTVEASGLVAANITAPRIVVRGAVKGDLTADEAVIVESGAKVVGDLQAPRITIVAGALVRGHVQTGAAGAKRPAAASTAHATKSRPAAAPVRAVAKAPPPPPSKAKTNNGQKAAPRGSMLAGTRSAPAPVVPVLKKGTKAVQKKRG
jgi:cytoskeletal protein CcmA (bactofilin family)